MHGLQRPLRLGLGLGTVALTSSVTAPAHADVSGPKAATGSFASRYRGGQETGWEVLYPPGFTPGDRLPVMITLHGKGGNHTTPEGLRFLEHAETLRAEGLRPFACVGVDGGDRVGNSVQRQRRGPGRDARDHGASRFGGIIRPSRSTVASASS